MIRTSTKTISIISLLICIVILINCTTPKTDPNVDQQLYELLESNSYFKLRSELEKNKDKLGEDKLLYYQAYCNNVFGRSDESNKNIELLLSKYGNTLNDSIKKDILEIRASNSIRLYNYKDVAEVSSQVLNEYNHLLDSSEIESYRNSQQLWSTIAEIKPQLIHKHGDVEIKAYYDDSNMLMVPVKCGGIAEDFIFDTGANISTIMESYAQKMGMTIYESNISVGTVTHIKIKTKLAAADSLYIGDLLFENVVFLVAPDEALSFPSHNLYIRGIIGFPVMHQMGEIHLRRDGSLYIPKELNNKSLANMFLDDLHPIVQVLSNTDTLIFCLDTGANATELSKQYYDNHKDEVEKNGELVKRQRGGGGGIMEVEEYVINNFPFSIGSKSGTLEKISVNIDDFKFLEKYDGNLGQDIFSKFNEMILNFTYMYLDFN